MELKRYHRLLEAASHNPDVDWFRANFRLFTLELEVVRVDRISLADVVATAFESLDQQERDVAAFRQAALTVGDKVDGGDDGTAVNEYHNALHFSKVVFNFRALAAVHNRMVDDGLLPGQPRLSDRDIARGLFAAAAHDICHDGTGNTINKVHTPFRLEAVSVAMARSWTRFSKKGLVSEGVRLIWGTDVTSEGEGKPSPAHTVRAWHDYYFKGTARPDIPAGKQEEILPRLINEQDESGQAKGKGILLASLLHDADVLSSVLTNGETHHFANEINVIPTPRFSLYFLENVLGGRMTTDAARLLGDELVQKQITRYRRVDVLQGLDSAPARAAAHPAEGTQEKPVFKT